MWLPTVPISIECSLKDPSSPLHFDIEDFPKALDLVIQKKEKEKGKHRHYYADTNCPMITVGCAQHQ